MTEPIEALYAGPAKERAAWALALRDAAAETETPLTLHLDPDEAPAERIEYLFFAPSGSERDLRRFPNLRAIFSLWAGVETLLSREDLPEGVPIARMVEPGLTQGMVDYVVGHVMRLHLGLEQVLAQSAAQQWAPAPPPLAFQRRIGVLGLGALGMEAARALKAIGFDVAGWSRTRKGPADGLPDGVEAVAGLEALGAFLGRSDILVALVPLTPETRGLMSAARLAQLPEGAHVINAARGPIFPEAALLEALGPAEGGGRLASATLDVFDREPLPDGHAYWTHPRVVVTPHIASVTRPETASLPLIRQILRDRRGQPLRYVVSPERGY
ncbi:MAG: glyoxylate/hydroxypyruvate reductase A [Pseudomonadota bacterium]